jgi:hypothetical protein
VIIICGISAKSPQARRWNKDVISLCLSLWIRSPKAYQTLLESNMFILPSGRQLRRYKNCIPQETFSRISDKSSWSDSETNMYIE